MALVAFEMTRNRALAGAAALVLAVGLFLAMRAKVSPPESIKTAQGSTDLKWHIFAPVTWNRRAGNTDQMFVVEKKVPDGELLQNVAFVLGYYRLPFKREGDVLMVSNASWSDKELMANVTSKARDPEWLGQHRSRQ